MCIRDSKKTYYSEEDVLTFLSNHIKDFKKEDIAFYLSLIHISTMMNVSPTQVITACMNLGLMVSINQRLDAEALVVVAEEFGYKVEMCIRDRYSTRH